VISGEGVGGLSTDLAPAVATLPEVAVASPVGIAPMRFDGGDAIVTTLDPATIESLVDLDVRQGCSWGVSAEAGSCDDVGDADPNCGEACLYE
jgi:hypothetical protein